jgi:fumarylpyruvate hydrolase
LTLNETPRAFALEAPTLPIAGTASVFPVRRIYCVGRNYVEHIREMKEGYERDLPFFFQKPADAIVQDGDEVSYPSCTDDLQHEIELVVAIGKPGRNIPIPDASDHVFGYAIGIDMTRRDRQREARERMLPWEIGKAFDQSAPCGPLHPVALSGHISVGTITLSVNGQLRQKGDLGQMIWKVPEIIGNMSLQYALKAGDLIFTGTPSGVGPVQPGDVLEGTIAGLSTVHFTIGSRSSGSCYRTSV